MLFNTDPYLYITGSTTTESKTPISTCNDCLAASLDTSKPCRQQARSQIWSLTTPSSTTTVPTEGTPTPEMASRGLTPSSCRFPTRLLVVVMLFISLAKYTGLHSKHTLPNRLYGSSYPLTNACIVRYDIHSRCKTENNLSDYI